MSFFNGFLRIVILALCIGFFFPAFGGFFVGNGSPYSDIEPPVITCPPNIVQHISNAPHLGNVMINEILINAPGSTSPPDCDGSNGGGCAGIIGEFVELYGPPGMNIGCYVLTDGDFALTIPAGTIIPDDGIFVIGSNNENHINVDLNIATCGCAVGGVNGTDQNVILAFTNTNDALGLYDPPGNLVDGVYWGDGVGGANNNGMIPDVGDCNPVNPGTNQFTDATLLDAEGYANMPAIPVRLQRMPDGLGMWNTNTAIDWVEAVSSMGSMNDDPQVFTYICEAYVLTGLAEASDNITDPVPAFGIRSDELPLNDPFPEGVTTILWTATDEAGNTSTCEQTITVVDDVNPEVECPGNDAQPGDPEENAPLVTINDEPDSENTGPDGSRGTFLRETDLDQCYYTANNSEFDPVIVWDNCPDWIYWNDMNMGASLDGEQFPTGQTIVVWTVEDAAGYNSTCTVEITVVDNQSPDLVCQVAQVRNTIPGQCNYVAIDEEFDPIEVWDNCNMISLTNDYNNTETLAGETFGPGEYVITWTVTDVFNNTTTCQDSITIIDEENPIISCPDTLYTQCTIQNIPPYGTYGEFVLAGGIATDNCIIDSLSFVLINETSDGENCPEVFIRTYEIKDIYGNDATCEHILLVEDSISPQLTCPGPIYVECSVDEVSPYADLASFVEAGGTAVDNCGIDNESFTWMGDESDNLSCPETVTRTYQIADLCGNTTICLQNIVIDDDIPPTINCPDSITVPAGVDSCLAFVSIPLPVTDDNCEVDSLVNDFNNGPDATGYYPLGNTTVIWTVTDLCGNSASCEMTVTVVDNQDPVVVCVEDQTRSTDPDECTYTVIGDEFNPVSVYDNCEIGSLINNINGTITLAGEVFPVGETIITWTLTDESANTGECVHSVTVADDVYPVVICPEDMLNVPTDAGLCSSSIVPDLPVATDNCTDPVTDIVGIRSDGLALDDPYPVGITTIVWTISDEGGNEVTCDTINIEVLDQEPPYIECPGDLYQATEPGVCETEVDIDLPEVSDNCNIKGYSNDHNGTNDASGVYGIGTTMVSYTIEDMNGNLNDCNFDVNIESPILANEDSAWIFQAFPVEIFVLANDIDCENEIDQSSLSIISEPLHGGYAVDHSVGSITYLPLIGYSGYDHLTYKICDKQEYCSSVEVTIYMEPSNIKPRASNIFDTISMNSTIIINISDYVYDPDGNNIGIDLICAEPVHGTIDVDHETLIITYTPFEDFTGNDSFCYSICDDGFPVLCDSANVFLEILPRKNLLFYNTLTPNGDGKNDKFIIGNIIEFPENELVIFNQWGDEMASYVNYNNWSVAWDCRNKDGKIVPYGTYYYILKLKHLDRVYKGWIYVHGSY